MKKLRKYKPRICVKCGKGYIPTGNRQRYCVECGKIHELEYNRRHTRERYYIDGVGEAKSIMNCK